MDIYFNENYGKLYEKMEGGSQEIFDFSCEYGSIRHQFIKRPIVDEWFDLITPYGYGGPVILETTDEERLVAAFAEAFAAYCKANKIVSEFVRFHPIVGNGLDFATIYGSEWNRHTIGTNLLAYEDPVAEEFSKSCRKSIRQALNKGVTYIVTEAPDSLDGFMEIYFDTMDRNNATEYYYFDKSYFEKCLQYFRENILLIEAIYEERTIAAGMYFVSEGTVHIHLSGTRSEFLHLSPAYILRYAAVRWAKEKGLSMIHHGGGRSAAEDDALYKFKEQFGKKTKLGFYIGKKIWNQKVYDDLCEKANADKNSSFFPLYRAVAARQ